MTATCSICRRALGVPADPMSHDCGGDCWGCIGRIEADGGDPGSRTVVDAETRAGLRLADGEPAPITPIDDRDFHERCAATLGTTYDCAPFHGSPRTRWNNRAPGGGRHPGFGIVRLFGDDVHVALHHPSSLVRTIHGRAAALAAIARMVAESQQTHAQEPK